MSLYTPCQELGERISIPPCFQNNKHSVPTHNCWFLYSWELTVLPTIFFTLHDPRSDTDSQMMHLLPSSLNKASYCCMGCREDEKNTSVASPASAFSVLPRSELPAALFTDFGSIHPLCTLLILALLSTPVKCCLSSLQHRAST